MSEPQPGTVGWLLAQLKHVDPDCYVYLQLAKGFAPSRKLAGVTLVQPRGTTPDQYDEPARGPDEGWIELDFE